MEEDCPLVGADVDVHTLYHCVSSTLLPQNRKLTCRYTKVQDRNWCLIRIEAFVHLVDSPRYRLEIAWPAVDVVELSVGTGSPLTPCSRGYQSADLDFLVPGLISPRLTAVQLTAQ